MKPTALQLEQIHSTLRSAYDLNSLKLMLSIKMGKRLEDLADMHQDFPTILMAVVKKATEEGWLIALLDAAVADRPERQDLNDFVKKFKFVIASGIASMKMPPEQLEQIHSALRSAYGLNSLELLLSIKLNKRLEDLTDMHQDFPTILMAVVKKATEEGWLLSLLDAAVADRPERHDLNDFVKKIKFVIASAMASMKMPPEQLEQIHSALLSAYDPNSLVLMLSIKLNRRLEDLTDIHQNFLTILWEVVRKATEEGWLLNLLDAAVADRPERQDLNDFVKKIKAEIVPTALVIAGGEHGTYP